MGIDPPFLYSAPIRYSAIDPYNGFDPRAVSRTSLVYSLPKPSPKQEGPLINFNRHPDSYFIVPYGQTNAKPMPQQAKGRIVIARRTQLALRLVQLAAAIGLLFCVICIKGMRDVESWTLRIVPAVGIVITLYGTYHLIRPAKGRTPATSASYHLFALIMDGGLVPFYAFAAITGKTQYQAPNGATDRWASFFTSGTTTSEIILACWLLATVNAVLHIVSLILSLYLAVMFRRITHLPPDMNPLEDNLTSRKHKRNKSSLSNANTTDTVAGFASPSDPSRLSQAECLPMSHQKVPFFQTRNDFDTSFSPHNPSTAADLPTGLRTQMSEQGWSRHVSKVDVQHYPGRPDILSQEGSVSFSDTAPEIPRKSSKRNSIASRYSQKLVGRNSLRADTMAEKPASTITNWNIVDADEDYQDPEYSSKGQMLPALAITYDDTSSPVKRLPLSMTSNSGLALSPLSMNPPDPPLPPEQWLRRGSTADTSVPGSSEARTNRASPKSRFYGDLGAAAGSVRGANWGAPLARDEDGRAVSKSGTDITDAHDIYVNDIEWGSAAAHRIDEGSRGGHARYRKISGKC